MRAPDLIKLSRRDQSEKDAGDFLQPHESTALDSPASASPSIAPQPPPDGGPLAWSQVLAGHLITMNAAGYSNAFGFFQAYYGTALQESPSHISWVGSIQAFMLLFVGAFSGRAVDAGYYYHVAVTGLVLQLIGVFMTSLVSKYWQLLLTQGICQGLGGGLVLTPTMAIVATYFSTKRAVAMSGASSGSATGGIIFPLIAQQLLPRLGIGWTIRIMGFVFLANGIIAITLVKTRNVSRTAGASVAFYFPNDAWFSLFGLGMFLVMLGLYFAYYYVTTFAQNVLLTSSSTSLSLLLVINALGVPGRFVPSYLSDQYIGPQNMLIIIVALTGILVYVWAAIDSLPGLWGFTVAYGLVAASIQSLTAPALASAGRDSARIGTEMGMIFTFMSFGLLGGPPIAGSLISRGGGNYLYAQMFAGSIICCGALLFLFTRLLSAGWKCQKC